METITLGTIRSTRNGIQESSAFRYTALEQRFQEWHAPGMKAGKQ